MMSTTTTTTTAARLISRGANARGVLTVVAVAALVLATCVARVDAGVVRVEVGGSSESSAFETTYVAVDADVVVEHALSGSARDDVRETSPSVVSMAAMRDGREYGYEDVELIFVARGAKAEDIDSDALRRIRHGLTSGDVSTTSTRDVLYAPNAHGGSRVADIVVGLGDRETPRQGDARKVFVSKACGVAGAGEDEDPLETYLRARAAGKIEVAQAVVMACEEGDARATGESFAQSLDTIERAGIRALGIFYGVEYSVACSLDSHSPTGRVLLALEQDESPECGLMCSTQVHLITGIIIFWGLLLTLLYGWGLMTDLDTPQYWASPDEDKKAQ